MVVLFSIRAYKVILLTIQCLSYLAMLMLERNVVKKMIYKYQKAQL